MRVKRRTFVQLSLSAAAGAGIPAMAAAGRISKRRLPPEQISIRTRDGTCRSYVFKPRGRGPWPGLLYFMDGFGIRPTLFDMAQRVADRGYLVLMPDLLYRNGPYEPVDVPSVYVAGGDIRKAVEALVGPSTNNRQAARDCEAFIAYLAARPDLTGRRLAAVGYCMSGGIALTVAGTYPDWIAAAASFHGGNLASDSEMSPHLLAPAIKGRVYIAAAEGDRSYSPEMAGRLVQALTAGGVDYTCELYKGARHGWNMADIPSYDGRAAERHWRALFALLEDTLR